MKPSVRDETKGPMMSDRWTNCVITIVLPLDDVGPDDIVEEKQGAAALLLSDCADTLGPQWSDAVMSAEYEDVTG